MQVPFYDHFYADDHQTIHTRSVPLIMYWSLNTFIKQDRVRMAFHFTAFALTNAGLLLLWPMGPNARAIWIENNNTHTKNDQ